MVYRATGWLSQWGVAVCGLVVRRRHPAANAIFLTLEDETGHSPVVLWPAVFEKFRFKIRAPVLMVWGRASRCRGVMYYVANRVRGYSGLWKGGARASRRVRLA